MTSKFMQSDLGVTGIVLFVLLVKCVQLAVVAASPSMELNRPLHWLVGVALILAAARGSTGAWILAVIFEGLSAVFLLAVGVTGPEVVVVVLQLAVLGALASRSLRQPQIALRELP